MGKKSPMPVDKPVTMTRKVVGTVLWFLALAETIFVVLFQTEMMRWVEPALIYLVTLIFGVGGYQSCRYIFSKSGIKREQRSMVRGFIAVFIIATVYIWVVTDQWTYLFALGCLIMVLGFFAKYLLDYWKKPVESPEAK